VGGVGGWEGDRRVRGGGAEREWAWASLRSPFSKQTLWGNVQKTAILWRLALRSSTKDPRLIMTEMGGRLQKAMGLESSCWTRFAKKGLKGQGKKTMVMSQIEANGEKTSRRRAMKRTGGGREYADGGNREQTRGESLDG